MGADKISKGTGIEIVLKSNWVKDDGTITHEPFITILEEDLPLTYGVNTDGYLMYKEDGLPYISDRIRRILIMNDGTYLANTYNDEDYYFRVLG